MNRLAAIMMLIVASAAVILAVPMLASQNPNDNEVEVECEKEVVPTMDEVTLHIGQFYDIILDSNPTTGYQWSVSDCGGLKYLDDFISDYETKGLVGAGGKQIFTIFAEKAGEYVFSTEYARSWESEPIETFEIKIIVDDVQYLCNDGSIFSMSVKNSEGIEWTCDHGVEVDVEKYVDGSVTRFYATGAQEGDCDIILKCIDSSGRVVEQKNYRISVMDENPYSSMAID